MRTRGLLDYFRACILEDDLLEMEAEEKVMEAGNSDPDPEHAICSAMEMVETDVVLNKELLKLTEESGEWESELKVPDVDFHQADDDIETVDEPPEKDRKVDHKVRTLLDVLKSSGFDAFIPPEKDNESMLLQRVRTLGPFMRAFNLHVRIAEKILSKAALTGQCRENNQHNIWEHELAEARAEYHCSAQRQSRMQLWADYSKRVEEAFVAEAPDKDHAEALVNVKSICPNSYLTPDGRRICQLLLLRPYQAGGVAGPLRVGVVIAVWRGGKSKKEYVWPMGHLPMSAATRLHAKLLVPQGVENEHGQHLLVASSLTAVVVCDCHNGNVLMEMNPKMYEYEYDDEYLKIWMDKKLAKAIGEVAKQGVVFSTKKKDEPTSKLFFCEEDFARTAAGQKNIVKYMNKMMGDYQAIFGPLEVMGKMKLRHDIVTSWEEIVARSQSYFKRYLKGSEVFKLLSKERQAMSCLGWCGCGWVRFSKGLKRVEVFLIFLISFDLFCFVHS